MHRQAVQVHLPPARLRARVTCLVVRRVGRVAGAAPIDANVHANPHACLNVIAAGTVACGAGPLPRAFVCGPLTTPMSTCVPDSVLSASLVFRPWLLPRLCGLPPPGTVDRVIATETLGSPGLEGLHAALRGASDGSRDRLDALWRRIEEAILDVPEPDLAFITLLAEGVEAAAAACASSERHYRRRFRQAMGLSPAQWMRLARWEAALPAMLQAGERPALAELASGAGYADQAHLTRDTRRIAGAPPGRLRQLVRVAEGHWALQPAVDGRILQDAA